MASKFELDLTRIINRYQGRLDDVVKKLNFDLMSRVIMRTPVDTGRARGNWLVGVNNKPVGTIELSDTATKGTNGTGAGRSVAKTAAQDKALTMKAGDVGFIVNHVEYIKFLEDGSSAQAPNGMVTLTVREYPGVVERAVQEAKKP